MVRETSTNDSVDPLSGLNGPSLFPRTIRASANAPVPSNSKDLDSIHNFMKSVELRSPQKLMDEAKKIVDGGAELLDILGFTGNMSITNAIAAKGKDKPQGERQGLGLARKRIPFKLRTNSSLSTENLNPTFDGDQYEDPNEFFDAYERMENAKKEIHKKLGQGVVKIDPHKPSNRGWGRRPGILGKSYRDKFQCPVPAENDSMSMFSEETTFRTSPSAPKDVLQEKIVHCDPNPDAELEEVELAASAKKADSINIILKEMLSCNDEDLDEVRALNILQQQLKISPLNIEELCIPEFPDVRRTNISTASENGQTPHKSSMLKLMRWKSHAVQEPSAEINPVSSPTPPRSPFSSISSFSKKILRSNPPKDPFSPLNDNLLSPRNDSPAQPKDKVIGKVDANQDVSMSVELESHVDFCNPELPISNVYAQERMRIANSIPEQFVDENASIHIENANSRPNAFPARPEDNLLEQFDAPMDLSMSSMLESHVEFEKSEPAASDMNMQEMIRDADSLPEQSVGGSASMQRNADIRPNEESEDNNGNPMNVNEDKSNACVLVEETGDGISGRQHTDPEQLPEAPAARPHKGKTVTGKRIRNSHTIRKSLAEAGTTFDNGVRRSKRIRSRPLEFWKGERLVFGVENESLKLLGLRYFSPGKGDENLEVKVKNFVSTENSAVKRILDKALLY